MDKIIQGLTQSGIVQKLSETEHNLKRFTKDIPDNAPYSAMSKREIAAYTPNSSIPDVEARFKIPRYGHLKRMYLKACLYFNDTPDVNQLGDIQGDYLSKSYDSSFFASFFTSAHLLIGGKEVEVLYPENIMFNANQLSGPESESVLMGLRGRFAPNADLGECGFDVQGGDSGDINVEKYANFTIPLEFSLFKFHKDSLDTTFIDKAEVILKKRAVYAYQTDSTAYTTCSLICKFGLYHPHFNTQLRNANYGKETVTKLISNAYIVPVHSYETTSTPSYEEDSIATTPSSASTQSLPQFPTSAPSGQFKQGFGQNIENDHGGREIRFVKMSGVTFQNSGYHSGSIVTTTFQSPGYNVYKSGIYYRSFNTNTNTMSVFSTIYNDLVTGDSITFEFGSVPEGSGLEGTWTITKTAGNISLNGYSKPATALNTYSGEIVAFSKIPDVENGVYKFDLSKMRYFIDDILITLRRETGSLDEYYGSIESGPDKKDFLKFTVLMNGERVFEKYHYELRHENHNYSSMSIQDRSSSAQGSKIFGLEKEEDYFGRIDTLDNNASEITDRHSSYKHSSNMYRIPFSMFSTDEFLNGGVNLESSNMELVIEGGMLLKTGTSIYQKCVPQVVVRTKSLARIDGKTGGIVTV